MKRPSSETFKEASLIVLIAASLGLVINWFHPKGTNIALERPALPIAPDTVLAQNLPGVAVTIDGIKIDNASSKPLLITTAQVVQHQQNDQLLLLDARSEAEFSSGHLPGALNLPYKNLTEYKTLLDSLPQDKWLVCYCDGPLCDLSELLAQELIIAGYESVAVYFDGLNGWKKSGYEIEGKEVKVNEN